MVERSSVEASNWKIQLAFTIPIIFVSLCIFFTLGFIFDSKFRKGISETPKERQPYPYELRNIRIIDGDTVEADVYLGFSITIKEKFRLEGINAPEIHGPEKPQGERSKNHLANIIGRRPTIELGDDEQDKYGRYLVIIKNEEINVNEQMVKDGYAKHQSYK